MSDFYEEWAAQFLSWANQYQTATNRDACEETASELLSLARACREAG